MNLETNLRRYLDGATASTGRMTDARYTSFDYCFNYFQSFRESADIWAIAHPENLQLSCLQLGFYLASWGMFRGRAKLLQRSVRHFVPIVRTISDMESSLWELDADRYTPSNIERIMEQASILRRANGGMSDTLVTKIMLGVFRSVPAFDRNFRKGFDINRFGATALRKIGDFYYDNEEIIEAHRVPTLDFLTGAPTNRLYTRAKVIDMVFFIEGM